MSEDTNQLVESFEKMQDQYKEVLQFALDGLAAGLSQEQRNKVAEVIREFLSK